MIFFALSYLIAWSTLPFGSFLAFSPDRAHAYAVDEESSEVVAFSLDGTTGALKELKRVSSAGGGPAPHRDGDGLRSRSA